MPAQECLHNFPFTRHFQPGGVSLFSGDKKLLLSVNAININIKLLSAVPYNVTPVKVASFEGMDKSLSCCNICCHRNVVNVAKS